MKGITSKYAEKMVNKTKGEEQQKWYKVWFDLLNFEADSKRQFIDEVLVPNFGFRKGIDNLIVKNNKII